MPSSRSIVSFMAVWLFAIATYASMSLVFPQGSQQLSTFGNIAQCIVPLVANAFLLLNAGTPHWRRNIFWMLLALSCTLWMLGEFDWTYWEVYKHESVPLMYGGDIVFFLRGIPMMAALALQPHRRQAELQLRLGYLDFVSLLTWWTFLYIFVVFPWMYALPSEAQYNFNYDLVTNIQNMVIVAGLGSLWLRSKGAWRLVYANLFGAATLYMLSSLTINVAITLHRYSTGSPYDLPLVSSFLWLAFAGLVAYRNRAGLEPTEDQESADKFDASGGRERNWASRLAMAAVLSLPLFAIYAVHYSNEPHEIRDYRTLTALIASIPLMLIIFLRTYIADKDRARLLSRSEQSVENLQRLQTQLVQTEKLVSLGQLAAGAAHEINNPLAAILGFSDLLADDPSLTEKARSTAAKIRDQARRTKTLVGNLLSFARQVPSERTLLDINTVVTNAIQLRSLERSPKTRIELQLESVLPGVRGDGNQLMQVFFNIVNNAVDAMESHEGGVLTVKTARDRGNVIILFSDTGPGIKDPHRVFDPFYTTKPVGKGTGLGLSICFGIVQEHAGKIMCYNGQTGGAVFRVELPAVLAALPTREPHLASATPLPLPPKR